MLLGLRRNTRPALIGLDTDELSALEEMRSASPYRGRQLARWIYRKGAHSLAEMTDLPQDLRERLEQKYDVGRPPIVAAYHSTDGTMKLLLEMSDNERVETVGLPYEGRFSCCVSTQVGCPVGCVFCASGAGGFTRNLLAGEIMGQVLEVQEAARQSQSSDEAEYRRVDHVVFMGMGEPLMNYSATLKAVILLNKELGIGMRNLAISTAGYVPGIRKLAREKLQLTLAISLHAPSDELRRRLVPGLARKWGLAELMEACRDYFRETGRRPTFEYCLLGRVNDGAKEAEMLAGLLQGLNCHVNLIPYNPVPGLSFQAPTPHRISAFHQILERQGIVVTQRAQRGADIQGACGQLRRKLRAG